MGATLAGRPAPVRERRLSPRIAPGSHGLPVELRLVPGLGAWLLNLSTGGACIQVESRLLPGTPVDMHVALPGWRWRGRAMVLRCRVSALLPGQGVRYEAGVQFDSTDEANGPRRLVMAIQGAAETGYQVPDRP